MTVQYYLIPLIAVMMLPVYAQSEYIDELDVGFDWLTKSCQESYLTTEDGTFKRLDCTYLEAITGDVIISKGGDFIADITIEKDADTETKISDDATIVSKPVIPTEQQIKIEGIITAREIVEAYGRGELDVEEFCFGGEVQESTIFEEHETIDIKRPFDNQPLQTNLQLKYEQLMSNICEAEYKLQYKVHNWLRTYPGEGEAYIFVPRDNFEQTSDYSPPWQNTTGLDNPQYAYDEAKMTDFNFEKSINTAEGFQCSVQGKAQGHCIKDIGETIVEPSISKEGKSMLDEWKTYMETGITGIPRQEADVKPDPFNDLEQFLNARGISEEDLKEWYESRK